MKTHSANLETLPSLDPRGADHAGPQPRRSRRRAPPPTWSCGPTPSQQDEVAAALAEVEAAAEESPLFRPSGTPVAVSTDGTVSVLTLAMPFDESDDRVDTAIKEIRSDLAPAALDGLSGPRRVRRRR